MLNARRGRHTSSITVFGVNRVRQHKIDPGITAPEAYLEEWDYFAVYILILAPKLSIITEGRVFMYFYDRY